MDGSERTLACMDAACSLALGAGARLVLVLRAPPTSPLVASGGFWAPGLFAFRDVLDRTAVLDRVPADLPVHVVDTTEAAGRSPVTRAAGELRCDTLVAGAARSPLTRWRARRLGRRLGLAVVWVATQPEGAARSDSRYRTLALTPIRP